MISGSALRSAGQMPISSKTRKAIASAVAVIPLLYRTQARAALCSYRILFFMEKCGWSDEQIQQFVMKNEFEDVPSARKELEGEKAKAEEPRRSRRSKRK